MKNSKSAIVIKLSILLLKSANSKSDATALKVVSHGRHQPLRLRVLFAKIGVYSHRSDVGRKGGQTGRGTVIMRLRHPLGPLVRFRRLDAHEILGNVISARRTPPPPHPQASVLRKGNRKSLSLGYASPSCTEEDTFCRRYRRRTCGVHGACPVETH